MTGRGLGGFCPWRVGAKPLALPDSWVRQGATSCLDRRKRYEGQGAVGVTDQMLRILGLAGLSQPVPPPTAVRHRELADTMRCLSDRFQDRLPAAALRRITNSAASGRWETATGQLVMALYMRDAPVSEDERNELREALQTLGLPAHRVDGLPSR